MTPSQMMRAACAQAGFTCRPYRDGAGWLGLRAPGMMLMALDSGEFSLYQADPLRMLFQGRGIGSLRAVLTTLGLPALPAARRRALLDPPYRRLLPAHQPESVL
jgi:hypothetical protein